MQSNFLIVPPLTKQAEFYQQLFTGIATYEELGNRILHSIKAAHAFRQTEQVRELSRILVNIPIREYQLIAQYYLVWSKCRKSKYHTATLERIIEQTRTYKAKALISRAAFEVYKGNMEHALYFYTEALRTNPTRSDYIKASTGIATVKSMEGFHGSALRDLENLLPLLRHAEPLNYFEVVNSYAVELGEVGHKQEARNISRIVLASPFIHAYPEWQETARGLKEPSRSSVTISPTPNLLRNVVSMPVVEHVERQRVSYNQPSRVTNLQQWKVKMRKEEKPGEELTTRQIVFKIIDFYTDENTTDEQRHRLWQAAQKIMLESNPPDSDDSEGA